MVALGLVGDIGATNARFALAERSGTLTPPRVLPTEDYATLADAIAAYLTDEKPSTPPDRAVLAVASPIGGDQIAMTNHPWTISNEALRQQLGLQRLQIINDFVACALAIPHLGIEQKRKIGAGDCVSAHPIGVLGPGTGFGVSALVPAGSELLALESEGGHVTMAAENAREAAVLGIMRRRYDHVSAERVLSGPGLVNLYNALCELAGAPAASFTSAQITDPRIGEDDVQAGEATAMFCAMLGSVAGNLALTLGARGGIYVAGGIVPRLGDYFERSEFRARFEAKGRFASYLARIPTYVVVHPFPALFGAASLLDQR
jgi:glucokinase